MAKQIVIPKPTKVPHNWCWIELGKLTSMKSGFPFDSKRFTRSKSANARPLIRIRDVVNGATETYTDQECPKEYVIKKGEILIGMDGDFNVGKWQSEDALLNQRVCCIQSCSSLYLDDFLFYYLPDPLKKINDATPSVTVKHLSTKTLAITPVPVPPLPEQQRIVNRIESLFAKLDEAKQKAQDALDSFETRKAAILHKAFTGELTALWRKEHGVGMESWTSHPLKNVAQIGSGGTPSRKNSQYYLGNILWIKTGEIYWNYIYDSEEKITEEAIADSSAKLYPAGTVLVAMYGQGLTRGRAAILGVPATTNQAVCALQPCDCLEKRYLYYYFMANYWEYREKAVGGNQPNYSATMIGKWIINIPSVLEQAEIVRILDDLLAKEQQAKDAAEGVLEQIDLIKKAILTSAFRGELGTNDPGEESAVELVKRVIERGEQA